MEIDEFDVQEKISKIVQKKTYGIIRNKKIF